MMMALVAAVGLSACQESSAKQENNIAFKIDNGEQLTADEYSTIIDYVGEYAEKAQKYVDMQINGDDLTEAAKGMKALDAEFPYVNVYRNCIRFTPSASLSPENLEKVAQYAGYVEFTAPSGYTISTSDAAGLEEQAPSTDNGVVAGAVDEVKEVDKGAW